MMADPMKLPALLNNSGPHDAGRHSHPVGGVPASISSAATEDPTSAGPALNSHKYSNSFSSTASSVPTSNSGLHSRNSSYSTNPESPPLASLLEHTALNESSSAHAYKNDFKFGNTANHKMADMADSDSEYGADASGSPDLREIDPQLPGRGQRLIINRPIDLTADDRAESPTDAVMPMRRRAAAGGALEPSR
jgi:hypothetical protein